MKMKVNYICESLFLLLFLFFVQKVTCFDLKCPSLRLLNGRSRYTWRGRSVRFNCMRGFQLVGVKYATCMNGKWDADVPICVKFGCRAPSTTHVNGQFIESYRGAVVKIVCNPGYTLIGSPRVYCNGYKWNETFPVCKALNKNPSLSCDFENPDLCGWNQDPMHDFDWKWQNGSSPMENASTTQDNVLKTDGHYMLMVNPRSRRLENDTARLYSPVYPPELSNGSCFSFWYKMNHDTTGILRVFVKPEGMMLYNLIPDFWINGNQGEKWQHGYFSIDTVDTPFQIVIEGVRSPDYSGDTAFDQVDLMSGEDCEALKQITSSTEYSTSVNPDEEGTDNGSCKNLCEQMVENGNCKCQGNCEIEKCCQDYYYYCQNSGSNTTVTETETETSLSAISTTSTKPEVEESGDNNEMNNEIDSGKMIVHVLPENNSNPQPVNRSLNEIPKVDHPERATNKTEAKNSVVVVEAKNGTEGKSTPEVFNSSKAIVRKIVEMSPRKFFTNVTRVEQKTNGSGESSGKKAQIKADKAPLERKPEVAVSKTNSTATTTPATTPSRPLHPAKPNKFSFVAEKPSSPILSNESRFHKGKSKEPLGKEPPEAIKIDRKEEASGQNVRRIIEIGGPCLGVITIIMIILGVVKYGRSRSRKLDRDNMVEDSDVRYLTSDEVLDFTLARPADDDL